MLDARDELTRKVALSPKHWQWGRLHQLELKNQSLGRTGIGAVRALLNRGPFEVGGGGAVVDSTNWDVAKGYDVTSASSMRMVVDLDDLERSRWVNLTGASGHVGSGHYRDQTPLWVKGDTLAWASGRDAVRTAAQHRLVLEP
jgi:penicillin amidase